MLILSVFSSPEFLDYFPDGIDQAAPSKEIKESRP